MEPHHHEHNHRVTSLNKAFIIGIVLNISFVIVEFGVGFYYDSLGLLSDAGHNLGDVASLILAMLAFRLEKVHPNSRYTYGYKKSTILVSLLNVQSPNQKIPDRKTKCVIKTHINIKQNVIFGAKLKPV